MKNYKEIINKLKNEKILVYCNDTYEKNEFIQITYNLCKFNTSEQVLGYDDKYYCGIINNTVRCTDDLKEFGNYYKYIMDFIIFNRMINEDWGMVCINDFIRPINYEESSNYRVTQIFCLMDIIEENPPKELYIQLTKEMFLKNLNTTFLFGSKNILDFKTIKDNMDWFIVNGFIIISKTYLKEGDNLKNSITNSKLKYCRVSRDSKYMIIDISNGNRYIDEVFDEYTTLEEVNKYCTYELKLI